MHRLGLDDGLGLVLGLAKLSLVLGSLREGRAVGGLHAGENKENDGDDNQDPGMELVDCPQRKLHKERCDSPDKGTKSCTNGHGGTVGTVFTVAGDAIKPRDAVPGRGNRRGPRPGRQPEDGSEDQSADKGKAEVQLGSPELGGEHGTEDEPGEDGLRLSAGGFPLTRLGGGETYIEDQEAGWARVAREVAAVPAKEGEVVRGGDEHAESQDDDGNADVEEPGWQGGNTLGSEAVGASGSGRHDESGGVCRRGSSSAGCEQGRCSLTRGQRPEGVLPGGHQSFFMLSSCTPVSHP